MQIGESSYTPPEPKVDENDGKEHVKLRFGACNDGTLNNRPNINQRLAASREADLAEDERRAAKEVKGKMSSEEIEKAKALYKEHGAKKDGEENSYEGFYTNVEKLERHLDAGSGKAGHDHAFKTYVEGAGTLDLAGDDLPGYAFAIWETGLRAKVEKAMQRIVAQIVKQYPDKSTFIIDKILIDVLGFSRGAAGARHLIQKILMRTGASLIERLQEQGYTVIQVEIGFAGLFDTVSSWGLQIAVGLANNVSQLSLDAVRHAQAALHLTAADEHRQYFALTDSRSCEPKGQEYALPGAHSDIGGGYRDQALEKQTIFAGGLSDAEQDRARLIEAGQYRDHEITLTHFTDNEGKESARLSVNRPGIKNQYSLIPLHIMAKAMIGQGMEFKADLEEKEVVPQELHDVQQMLETHCTGPSKTDADYWRNNHAPWLKQLRHEYLHFSARLKTGHEPRFKGGRRRRMTYDG